MSNMLYFLSKTKTARTSKRAFSTAMRQEPVRSCFTWGQTGKESSLGLGEISDVATPTELPCPDGSGFLQVSHGPKHSAIVTGKGGLYVFGASNSGQLGIGEEIASVNLGKFNVGAPANLVTEPKQVEALSSERVLRVSCGANHTACVTEKGVVWTWGWGGAKWGFGVGGLGHGNKNTISLPHPVEGLYGRHIVDIVVGDSHTLALDDKGLVWAFGEGEHGRLGTGRTSSAKVPECVEFFDGASDSSTVQEIYSNKEFSIVLTKDGSLYGWGRNDRQQLGLGGGLAMDIYSCENSPQFIAIESGITHAALSQADCLAITEDNDILAWGDRRYLEPTTITEMFTDEQIEIGFSKCGLAGIYHAFILKDGSLWTCNKKISLASASVNCLGQGYCDPYREPRRVESLEGRIVKDLACADNQISILCD